MVTSAAETIAADTAAGTNLLSCNKALLRERLLRYLTSRDMMSSASMEYIMLFWYHPGISPVVRLMNAQYTIGLELWKASLKMMG